MKGNNSGEFVSSFIKGATLILGIQSRVTILAMLDILTLGDVFAYVDSRSLLMEHIWACHFDDEKMRVICDKVFSSEAKIESLDLGVLRIGGYVCVPKVCC